MQQLADRALVQLDVVAGLDQCLEVDPSPTHHAVPIRVRSPLHDRRQLGPLLRGEARLAPRPGPVAQAGEPSRVVAMHPVAQGLPVHAGVPRRFLPRGPLQHQGQGQHPPRGRRVPAPPRLAPQFAGAQLAPRDRDRHPGPPVVGVQPQTNRVRRDEAPRATTRQEFGPLVSDNVSPKPGSIASTSADDCKPLQVGAGEVEARVHALAITHIFPYRINGLLALLEVVSFWAEPFEGLRFV